MQYVDLDAQLRDAEAEHADAEKRLDEATRALEQVRARIAAYDSAGDVA